MGKPIFGVLTVYVVLVGVLAFNGFHSAHELRTGCARGLSMDKDTEAWRIINAESSRQARK